MRVKFSGWVEVDERRGELAMEDYKRFLQDATPTFANLIEDEIDSNLQSCGYVLECTVEAEEVR